MAEKVDPSVVAVIVGTDFKLSAEKMALASLYVNKNKAELIGTNIDRNDGFDRLRPSGGSLVKLVEEAVGASKPARIMGKPDIMCFDMLREQHGLQNEPLDKFLFVGDNLSTDILFGNHCSIDTLLVLRGVTSAQKADLTIQRGKEELPAGIAAEGIPTYVQSLFAQSEEINFDQYN